MTDTKKPGEDLAEDILGFGRQEVVTARDLLVKPSQVLAAWMEQGAEGGGRYARPLRLYLALNAILMLLLFLRGGAGFMLDGIPDDVMGKLLERTGKSRDGFVADAEGWMTLVMVPVLSIFYSVAVTPLLRWWDKADLGWRRGFRASFAWLNAWTVPMLPLAWWSYGNGTLQVWMGLAITLLGMVAFLRMGRGRWYQSNAGGIGKAIVLMIVLGIAAQIGGLLVGAIGLLGGVYS
ncbi:hypothetical protein OB03_13880 [Brevundimonas sp. GN22]